MEPIYEARTAGGDGPRWIYRTADGTHVFDESMPRSMAAHIVRLLNADPLPEDRPKQFGVHDITGFCLVQDGGGLDQPWVAAYRKDGHPDALAAAEAHCARLNAEASNVQA